jgi:hypothetical protein
MDPTNYSSYRRLPFANLYDNEDGCHTEWHVLGSQAQKKLHLVPNTLKMQILSSSQVNLSFRTQNFQIQVSASISVNVQVPAFLKPCKHVLFACFCVGPFCDGIVTAVTFAQVSVIFSISYDQTGKITVVASPNINILFDDIQGCHFPGIITFFVDVQCKSITLFLILSSNRQ